MDRNTPRHADPGRPHRAVVVAALLLAAVSAMVVTGWLIYARAYMAATGDQAVLVDFRIFWATARLAVEGQPLAAFDVENLRRVLGDLAGSWSVWSYPPGFLLMLSPLGFLDFLPAWVAFTGVSALAMLVAARAAFPDTPALAAALVFAPCLLPAYLLGQTSVLWCAVLLLGLSALRDGRAIRAGICIGLLTIKPQLGLLILVALLAGREWRVIAWASVTAIILSAIATLFTGVGYWPALLAMMDELYVNVQGQVAALDMMLTSQALLLSAGASADLAGAVQLGLMALAAISVGWVWGRKGMTWEIRAATLLCAIPFATPYFWIYESALLAPAALLLWRAGALGRGAAGLVLAAAMWIGLGPVYVADSVFALGGGAAYRLVFLVTALSALAACVLAAAGRYRVASPRVMPSA